MDQSIKIWAAVCGIAFLAVLAGFVPTTAKLQADNDALMDACVDKVKRSTARPLPHWDAVQLGAYQVKLYAMVLGCLEERLGEEKTRTFLNDLSARKK